MNKLRNISVLAIFSMFPFSHASAYQNVVGVAVGSQGYAVNYNRENFRLSIAFDDFSAGLDLLWNMEWAGNFGGYSYTGAVWVDDPLKEWGIKTGLGIAAPMGSTNMEMYAEYGPVWYGKNRSDIEFEGSVGVRFAF
ncbi:hypothetical protein CS022_02605 [Veronia nyctiphanis]|uniref:Uncharacterized protein n=1 Tax=Veronia nyctiphanis TaxID=1278244 RepID=A0A4Q0YTA2_9GAMM|nr:hypothetical protein [Veronia nyctiphanis]RXJ74492.1 hypothetical protein CS022_02605 [Veronia nyctiphanis]